MIFYKKSLFKPWNGWLNISYNFHFLLTLLVALTLPIDVRAQFCSFAIVLLFINWLFSGRYEKKLYYLKHSKEGLLMLLFFLLHLVALIYTGDLKEGFFDIEKKLALFIVPLVLISFPLNVSQRDFILACFIIFCVILSIIGFCYGLLHYQEVIKNKG